ncbi:hypothetical protein ACFL2O_05355 [Thermodesulfobacteriota bacterium]
MRNLSIRLIVAALSTIVLFAHINAYCEDYDAKRNQKVEINMYIQKNSVGDYLLKIDLISKFDKPVKVNLNNLPWIGRYSMVLHAVKSDIKGSVLKQTADICDIPHPDIEIKAGDKLSGLINLNNRFPQLKE